MQFSEETLDRARTLFPTNYTLAEYIRNNDKRALDIIREMEVEPHIHVNEVLEILNQPIGGRGIDWSKIALIDKAQRISDIVALEELMLDELGIMEINN